MAWKIWPALITHSLALITPLNAFPNIIAANVANNILRNPPSSYFTSFLIASLNTFISNLNCSSDLTIFILSSIFSFKIINAVVSDP